MVSSSFDVPVDEFSSTRRSVGTYIPTFVFLLEINTSSWNVKQFWYVLSEIMLLSIIYVGSVLSAAVVSSNPHSVRRKRGRCNRNRIYLVPAGSSNADCFSSIKIPTARHRAHPRHDTDEALSSLRVLCPGKPGRLHFHEVTRILSIQPALMNCFHHVRLRRPISIAFSVVPWYAKQ